MDYQPELQNALTSRLTKITILTVCSIIFLLTSMTAYLWLPRAGNYFMTREQVLAEKNNQIVAELNQQVSILNQRVTQLMNQQAQSNLISKKQLKGFEDFVIFKLKIMSGASFEFQLKKFLDTYQISAEQLPTLTYYAPLGTAKLQAISTTFDQEYSAFQAPQSKWQTFKNWLHKTFTVKSSSQAITQPNTEIVTLIKSEQYQAAKEYILINFSQKIDAFKYSLKMLDDCINLERELEWVRQKTLSKHQ